MIGDKIKARRIELDMTQDELARLVGYKSRSAINKIELNLRDISSDKIVEFAKVLHTTPLVLLGLENDEPVIIGEDQFELTEPEQSLIDMYRDLNPEGQKKLTDYADDLVSSGKYEKRAAACVGESA